MSLNFSIFNLNFLSQYYTWNAETLQFYLLKVKVFFLVLVYIFNFDLLESSASILDLDLLVFIELATQILHCTNYVLFSTDWGMKVHNGFLSHTWVCVGVQRYPWYNLVVSFILSELS